MKTWEGWGLGSYCFFNVDPTIHATHAFEVPVRPGVRLHDLLSLSITNHGTIDHVVNDTGGPVDGGAGCDGTPSSGCGTSTIAAGIANTFESPTAHVPANLRTVGARYCADADCTTPGSFES